MTMLFDIEKYQHPDSLHHKGDWDNVKYDPAWDDGSAFPEKNYKTSLKETARSNKTDCWYTPPSIIELVIQVLGEINLDSCADDGQHIPAGKHYTFDDNGLEQPWCGKVYMNPPYSHPGVWMKKLQLEFETGNVDEAIALVPAATDTNWLSPVLKTQPVCFWKGRIKFLGQDYKPKSSARQSHVLVYWGNNWQKFREVFEDYGVVYFPLSAFVSEGNSIEDVAIPVNQTGSTNRKVDTESVLPVNQTGSTNEKSYIETVLPVKQTSSTNGKVNTETVLPANQTSSTNGKVNTKTVLPVDQTGSTNGKVNTKTVLPANQTSSTNGKVEMETVLPVNQTGSTNGKLNTETVLPVNQTGSTNIKTDIEAVLPVDQTGSTNGKLNTKTVLPVDQTGSTNIKTDIEAVLPVNQTSSTNGKVEMETVLPVDQTGSTNGKINTKTVLPVDQTGSTNGKLNTETVLPVDQTGSTNIKTDIEAVLPVDQTGSTNGKLNTKTVLPVDQTGSTKRRSRGEGTGRIHWRAITKKNGKQYQQAWYDWQLIKGKTIYKSTYIPKRLLSQVQKLEDHKAPVREILKILGVNQKLL